MNSTLDTLEYSSMLLNHPFKILALSREPSVVESLNEIFNGTKVQVESCDSVCELDLALKKPHHLVISYELTLPYGEGHYRKKEVNADIALNAYLGRLFPKHINLFSGSQRELDIIPRLKQSLDLYVYQTIHSFFNDKSLKDYEILKDFSEFSNRMRKHIFADTLECTFEGSSEKRLTTLGAFLKTGIDTLPPNQASQLKILSDNWETPTHSSIDAAVNYMIETVKMAFMQSAVIYKHENLPINIPHERTMQSYIATLKDMKPELSVWNWGSYISEQALNSLDKAFTETITQFPEMPYDVQWNALRSPLQHAMDISAFWMQHPLSTNHKLTRDGYTAEVLSGVQLSGKRSFIRPQSHFPFDNREGEIWQNVWRLDKPDNPSEPIFWTNSQEKIPYNFIPHTSIEIV